MKEDEEESEDPAEGEDEEASEEDVKDDESPEETPVDTIVEEVPQAAAVEDVQHSEVSFEITISYCEVTITVLNNQNITLCNSSSYVFNIMCFHNQAEVANGNDSTLPVETPPSDTQDDLTANEHGLNFLGESEVSSKSRIHADAPPFIPSSASHVPEQPQTATFDPDFAPAETGAGWDEPSEYGHFITVQ